MVSRKAWPKGASAPDLHVSHFQPEWHAGFGSTDQIFRYPTRRASSNPSRTSWRPCYACATRSWIASVAMGSLSPRTNGLLWDSSLPTGRVNNVTSKSGSIPFSFLFFCPASYRPAVLLLQAHDPGGMLDRRCGLVIKWCHMVNIRINVGVHYLRGDQTYRTISVTVSYDSWFSGFVRLNSWAGCGVMKSCLIVITVIRVSETP